MELNDTNLNIIRYILDKKNRTQNELLIIKEFLSSLNLFNNQIQNINKDKLLLSLSSFLKMENMPKNSILFKFGNKGNKFYIVIKGELSVLILRETKVELNSVDYFIYLLLLRLLKEDELLKKTLLANNKIGLRMDEINFEYNYEKLVKFFNKYFKVNYKRNKDIKKQRRKFHYSIVVPKSNLFNDLKGMKRRSATFTSNVLPDNSEENNNQSKIEKIQKVERTNDDEQYNINKYKKSIILNNIILKKNDDVFYSELELYNF